jgi:type IV pilus assembly protein PilC
MRFSYTATTHEGKTLNGVYEAPDRDALIGALSKQGLRPILIKIDNANGGGMARLNNLLKPKVGSKDLVMFTRQLSTLISAGVPLPRSLSTLQEQTENKYFKR